MQGGDDDTSAHAHLYMVSDAGVRGRQRVDRAGAVPGCKAWGTPHGCSHIQAYRHGYWYTRRRLYTATSRLNPAAFRSCSPQVPSGLSAREVGVRPAYVGCT